MHSAHLSKSQNITKRRENNEKFSLGKLYPVDSIHHTHFSCLLFTIIKNDSRYFCEHLVNQPIR